ncbi:retrotransposon protein [Cucumis melo var. makuwa]|uniref:Retrotransposon protein n=1 Tax=Cucumis melo var. makuwa TaxID=1194695 RepID=A0A5A7TPM0_CUCMM|nr:retrotransposon protein [Cucumis melo var. makuwa]
MTNVDDLENIDEGDLAYASPIEGDNVHYIETLNEWTQWWDDLATTMFNECSSRALKHAWTKEEEAIPVECLVELVFAGDGSRTMARSPTRLPDPTCSNDGYKVSWTCPTYSQGV